MEKLLTPRELGAMLGLAEQTIYNRKSYGGDLPPSVKLGRALRFPLTLAEAWIAGKLSQNVEARATPAITYRRRGRPTKALQVARRGTIDRG